MLEGEVEKLMEVECGNQERKYYCPLHMSKEIIGKFLKKKFYK